MLGDEGDVVGGVPVLRANFDIEGEGEKMVNNGKDGAAVWSRACTVLGIC